MTEIFNWHHLVTGKSGVYVGAALSGQRGCSEGFIVKTASDATVEGNQHHSEDGQ